jgi:hypothetical protein
LISKIDVVMRVCACAAYGSFQFLDADVFLTTTNTLDTLIGLNKPIVAPMLVSEGLYSNFW